MTEVLPGRLTLAVPTCFNDHEADTVDAIAARIIPGDDEDPGAREAGAVAYIDQALTGAYQEHSALYRRGVAELDELSGELHGAPFAQLSAAGQDELLTRLCDPHASGQPVELGVHGEAHDGTADARDERHGRLAYFFEVVREHVIQGTFCDPVYGGNQGGVGWRLVGFPGAYWDYTEQHGQLGFDAAELPIKTLADLRRERAEYIAQDKEQAQR